VFLTFDDRFSFVTNTQGRSVDICLGSVPSAGHLFRYVINQPPNASSAFHPSGVGRWVPASAGKAKAGMVHSVSGWTQVKLWDPLRTRAIPERLRGVFTTRHYTNTRLPLPYLTSKRLTYVHKLGIKRGKERKAMDGRDGRTPPPQINSGYSLWTCAIDIYVCVSVCVSVSPVISRQDVDTTPTVTVNDTSVLSCPVTGTPSPDVVWLRDGRLLDTTLHPNIHLVASGRQLRINSAAVTDTAVYRCLATNKAGRDYLDYNLSVHSESMSVSQWSVYSLSLA